MCGIIGQFIRKDKDKALLKKGIKLMDHRGPDNATLIADSHVIFGHTRLSIIDLSPRSNQPFIYGSTLITFNGEIWNYKELREQLLKEGLSFDTESDTEVIAAILDLYGSSGLKMIQGMFAVAWKVLDEPKFYIARDIFGEIPVHFLPSYPFPFCSELKILRDLGYPTSKCINVPPGSFLEVSKYSYKIYTYYDIPLSKKEIPQERAASRIFKLLRKSVKEREISDVPICTLLSGGIDSSVITYFLSKTHPDLIAYTAVFYPKSKDLFYARKLAKELNIELREVEIPIPTEEDLTKIIEIIEVPYKAQVEIGWICYHLAKQIKKDGFKVVFSGEGSDELFASYAFTYHALKTEDFHEYRKKLFLTQERKNFIRTNKIFMHFGIEARLPFLNNSLVKFILSLPAEVIRKKSNLKYVLSLAFSGKINDEILFRPKVAFQDGLKIKEVIQDILGGKGKAISFYKQQYKRLYHHCNRGLGLW